VSGVVPAAGCYRMARRSGTEPGRCITT
jgi:hypothetical protein